MASQYLCSEAVLLHVEKAQELEPDVVLMDISRPAIDRSELTRQLRKTLPGIRIVIFSLHESQQILRKSGVQGPPLMLLKSDLPAELEPTFSGLVVNRLAALLTVWEERLPLNPDTQTKPIFT